MKKLSLLVIGLSMVITACNDDSKNMTVYDYLIDKPLLDTEMKNCTSGKENNKQKCEIVKSAYNKYGFFIKGLYTEKDLKELGKK
ncbi:hypothetical protein CBE90_04700 [Pasteurella multocida]|uniref:hypothetical protein n=1 Tax=Pasteurella multocida TaxID=747 RepID=UPI000CE92B6C|nr:hypothetical protein [Pasteurella multocida]PPE94938.1 hypothetical protein CBE90_04700 [Pasteurella multocida]PPE95031.1 hypothetical protein CBE91_10225 [Pasteurella multocida]